LALLIRERYEPLEPLGAGGEARVVKALDRQLGRLVALKIRRAPNGGAREELLREARVLLAVPPHPALPLVREDFFDGDDYVLAMDWVDGTDLATLLRDRGRPGLAPSSVLAYLSEAAEALAHLHAQEPPIVHGDVKPANLILTTGGRVKLVDFGLSSTPGERHRRAGTRGYRAPELAANADPSEASDVYGLAATAFALLTGSAPTGVLPTWEGVDPVQARQFEAAIRLGLSTDPSRRPAAPGELVERLRAGWAEALPTGVVTFCVSDIPSSAAQWEGSPAAMALALVRHDELIADAMARHGGRLIKSMGQGDATVSAFESAPAAVAAAIAAVRSLGEEHWPAGLHITPRFALHTGASDRRGTDYYGPSVNLAVWLRGQADNGEVLLSNVTAELVADHLPDGYTLVDLGPHALEGAASPERVHALRGPGVQAPLAATECPYRGLLAFEPEDRNYFFGREPVVSELVARLTTGRMLSVVGASGSGKSSVLRAGVIAAVRAGDVPGLERAQLVTPGSDPALTPGGGGAAELLVVDQFEELFTHCEDAARRATFIEALLARRGAVVIGVRADMYGRLAEHPALARAVAANQMLLGPMSDTELARAVTEPARLAGLRPEPGLVELAVREVAGEPGALPLLSHALRATWERRRGRSLTVESYQASGGVASAVALTPDAVLDELPATDRQLMRSIFLRLTELHDEGAETRRRVRVVDLAPAGVAPVRIAALIERLADARLITLDEGTAEVAHEVLIRRWPTLRAWLEEDREGIRLHRHLGDAARAWDAGGREPSDLYRGSRLATATDWASSHREELNAGERAFIDAGVAEADRERRRTLRTNRRLRGLLVGAVSLLVVALFAGVVALVQRNHARAQALTSDAERVGAQALTDANVDHSLLLAVAGVRLQNRVETRSDLFADLQQNAALIRLLRPSDAEISALRVSPDGRLLAVGDLSGTVRFIDLATWKPFGAAVHLEDPVGERALSFSPDGRTLMALAIGAARSELYAIDVAQRRARLIQAWNGVAPEPPIGFEAVAYSPDGRHVAVTHDTEAAESNLPTTSRLLLLGAASGRIVWQRRYPLLPGQDDPDVAFTPAGTLLTSAQQGDTLLWNPRTGRIVRRFALGGLPAIAPNGDTVALGQNSPFAGNQSASITLLHLRNGAHRTLLATLPDYWIRSLAFTPDGTEIAGAATDGMHVWDLASGKIIASYVAGAGPRSLSTLDPSGRTLISGAQDGSIAAFDISGGRRLGRAFSWNTPDQGCGYAPCTAINRQSELMATDQGDGTVAVVDLRTLRLVRTLPARDGSTTAAIAFTPDGRTLITGGINRRVTFWNVATGRITRTLRFADPVWWTAPSPDGKLLAVQTAPADQADNRIEVVRIATGKVLQSHGVPHGPNGVEFSPDGRDLLALGCCWTGSGSTLIAWDARTGRRLFSLSASLDAESFAFTPDSHVLGVGTGAGELRLLDPRTGQLAGPPIRAAAGEISDVSFSPDGRSVAVSSNDHTVSVWDLRSRMRLGNAFGPYPGTVPIALFEPNGRLLIELLSNAIEWPMDVNTWERFACQAAGRDLTRPEWHDLLPNRAYRPVCPA
jgi:WD40 repeat protein/class 3 adenylate cyclase